MSWPTYLNEIGLSKYVKKKGTDILLVSFYVDDLIYTGNNEKMIEELKRDMMETYEMSDLGLLHWYRSVPR